MIIITVKTAAAAPILALPTVDRDVLEVSPSVFNVPLVALLTAVKCAMSASSNATMNDDTLKSTVGIV